MRVKVAMTPHSSVMSPPFTSLGGEDEGDRDGVHVLQPLSRDPDEKWLEDALADKRTLEDAPTTTPKRVSTDVQTCDADLQHCPWSTWCRLPR